LAEIEPFPGILYRVPEEDLPRVLAPPYDVIPPAYQEELYARDPRNIVRVILNRRPGDDAYREAGETFRRWREEGLLAPDPEPALYVLEQAFAAEGRTLRRFGLLARFRADDPAKRVILPHAAVEDHAHDVPGVARVERFLVRGGDDVVGRRQHPGQLRVGNAIAHAGERPDLGQGNLRLVSSS